MLGREAVEFYRITPCKTGADVSSSVDAPPFVPSVGLALLPTKEPNLVQNVLSGVVLF